MEIHGLGLGAEVWGVLGFGVFFGWLVSWGLGGGVAVLFWCFVITQAIIAEADKIMVLVCNWLIHF